MVYILDKSTINKKRTNKRKGKKKRKKEKEKEKGDQVFVSNAMCIIAAILFLNYTLHFDCINQPPPRDV